MFSCQVQILRKMVSKTIAGARQNIRWRKTSGQILTINKYRKNVLSIFIYIHIYVCIYIYILNIWPLVFLHRMFCFAPAIVLLIIFLKIWTWQENINFEWKSLQRRGIHSKIPSNMRDPMKNTAKKPGSDQRYRKYCKESLLIFNKKIVWSKVWLLEIYCSFFIEVVFFFRDRDLCFSSLNVV